MMTPTNMLNSAIAERNYRKIVGALMGYVFSDRTMNDFSAALRYVESQGIPASSLYSPYDPANRPIDGNPANWDTDYYCVAVAGLEQNFCSQRIEHVKQVARKVYAADFARSTAGGTVPKSGTAGNGASPKKAQGREKGLPLPAIIGIIAAIAIIVVVIVFAATRGN